MSVKDIADGIIKKSNKLVDRMSVLTETACDRYEYSITKIYVSKNNEDLLRMVVVQDDECSKHFTTLSIGVNGKLSFRGIEILVADIDDNEFSFE